MKHRHRSPRVLKLRQRSRPVPARGTGQEQEQRRGFRGPRRESAEAKQEEKGLVREVRGAPPESAEVKQEREQWRRGREAPPPPTLAPAPGRRELKPCLPSRVHLRRRPIQSPQLTEPAEGRQHQSLRRLMAPALPPATIREAAAAVAAVTFAHLLANVRARDRGRM